MKRIIILIIFALLIAPILIHAEDSNISIKSIDFIEKSEDASFITKPTFKDNTASFNIHFTKLKDYLKYKVIIHNGTKEDYIIGEGTSFSNNKLFKYTKEIEGKKDIIKSGEDISMYLYISYDKELNPDKFIDGVYAENNEATIYFTAEEVNPKTSAGIIIGIIIMAFIISLIVFSVSTTKLKIGSFIIMALISIPFITNALKKATINIQTTINITNKEDCKFITSMGSFSKDEVLQEIDATIFNDGYKYNNLRSHSFRDTTENNTDPVSDVFFIADYYMNEFSSDSYINIYEDNTKENLLKTITKEYFGREGYSIQSNDFTNNKNIYVYLGKYNYNNIYIETSNDLKEIVKPKWNYAGTSSSRVFNQPIVYKIEWIGNRQKLGELLYYDMNAPWVYDQDSIEKIKNLYNSLGGHKESGMWMMGFERKNEVKTCIYEARWEFMEGLH